MANLESACGLTNVTNLVQDGASVSSNRAADSYMGFKFRATSGGITYNYEVALKGATGTQVVNTRTAAPPGPAITVTPGSLADGIVATTYSQTMGASGGTPAYSYSISAGALPRGLTLAPSTGVLSGTPTDAGTFNFSVTAADANSYIGTRAYSINIGAPRVLVTPGTLARGSVGSSYSQTVSATGGIAPYSYAVSAGTLPAGLTIDPNTGVIGGTPTAGGGFVFTISATSNSTGVGTPHRGLQPYTLDIDPPIVSIVTTGLPNGTVASAYSQTFAASGGTAGYSFRVTAGALPPGLTLSASGALTGTPTAGGTFNFTVTAVDSSTGTGPYTASRNYSLTISAPTVTLNPATLPGGAVAASYSQALRAAGGIAPYSYDVSAGALPAGLSLSSGGVLSGTPTAGGTFNFTVRATDSSAGAGPYSGSQGYSLVVTKAAQTLTFAAQDPASQTYASGGSFPLNPVATSDSPASPARPITYASLSGAVCTVSGTTVTMVSPGNCTIAANQAGDAGYDPAPQVTQSVAINGIKTFSGITVPAPGGTPGPASASFTGGGAACGFDVAQTGFVAGATPPVGQVLPQGLFRFRLTGCDIGSTVTIRVTWPEAITDYGKFGPATAGAAGDTWFTPPNLSVSGNTATFTITDNGIGDGDAADGVIRDPSGPLAPAPVAVPALDAWGLALLAALAGALGLRGRRRWRAA